MQNSTLPAAINESHELYRSKLLIDTAKTCECSENHLNCLTAKEWLKSQLGVWQFAYEGRDVRKKDLHPATFPISLAKKIIQLFSHEGELILDPFVGSGCSFFCAWIFKYSYGFYLPPSNALSGSVS